MAGQLDARFRFQTGSLMPNQTIHLHAGELSPDEMRCVQAALGWKQQEILERADRE